MVAVKEGVRERIISELEPVFDRLGLRTKQEQQDPKVQEGLKQCADIIIALLLQKRKNLVERPKD